MFRYIRVSQAAVLLVAILSGCATPYDPFVLSNAEIHERVNVICLFPLSVPDFERHPEVSARYESLIVDRLRGGGFTVIDPREVAAISNRVARELGGVYDPVTGKPNMDKLQAMQERTISEINTKFKFDAYMTPEVRVVGASWTGNIARWDGVSESSTGKTGFWASFVFAPQAFGTIAAFSLVVPLKSRDGETYYVGRGGIHLAAHLDHNILTAEGKFVPTPESEWFRDEARDVNAVTVALSPLLRKPTPQK